MLEKSQLCTVPILGLHNDRYTLVKTCFGALLRHGFYWQADELKSRASLALEYSEVISICMEYCKPVDCELTSQVIITG